tara:strand:+ start:188 stop:949 length:762 start_codon:yes stop_codon:yes gene_type:complete
MKYIRFKNNNKYKYGILRDKTVVELNDSFFVSSSESGNSYSLDDIDILPPVSPSKIIALGYNYKDLVGERISYDEPVIFLKPPSSILAHNGIIEIKKSMKKIWSEVELCIVIGKKGVNVEVKDASSYIFGFTIGNDVTTSNILSRDHHLARSKAWNTFCPIGPWIENDINTDNLLLKNKINGKTFQKSNTNMRIFNDKEIVSHLSKIMMLMPGDIIMTGTPANAENSIIQDGDSIELFIEGLGTLSNKVQIVN